MAVAKDNDGLAAMTFASIHHDMLPDMVRRHKSIRIPDYNPSIEFEVIDPYAYMEWARSAAAFRRVFVTHLPCRPFLTLDAVEEGILGKAMTTDGVPITTVVRLQTPQTCSSDAYTYVVLNDVSSLAALITFIEERGVTLPFHKV